MGTPVVIAENGVGVPVRPVDAGAPVLTVAENGLGVPIVISDSGAPFVVEGWSPTPAESPFSPATVTAGVSEFGDTGYYRTVYGSISAEPLPDFTLLELATRNEGYTQVAFTGDCLSIVQGWRPVIDGVTLTVVLSAWEFDGSNTTATWSSSGDMVPLENYPITWEME